MDDREKLIFLLGHWKDHTHEHGQTYHTWALKAHDLGEADVSRLLKEVTALSGQIEERLEKARHML